VSRSGAESPDQVKGAKALNAIVGLSNQMRTQSLWEASRKQRRRRVETDPVHSVQGQTFSNVDDYVRSRLNAGELKAQYSRRLRSPVNACELKTTAW
jgi:hypothetical protein